MVQKCEGKENPLRSLMSICCHIYLEQVVRVIVVNVQIGVNLVKRVNQDPFSRLYSEFGLLRDAIPGGCAAADSTQWNVLRACSELLRCDSLFSLSRVAIPGAMTGTAIPGQP